MDEVILGAHELADLDIRASDRGSLRFLWIFVAPRLAVQQRIWLDEEILLEFEEED